MIKSLEDSGKLMVVTRSTVLGDVSEVDPVYRPLEQVLPKVQGGEKCVLVHVIEEVSQKRSTNSSQNSYYVVYVPRLQKIGWLWGSELESLNLVD